MFDLISFHLVGLVDAETDEEFIAQLESFKEVWNRREKENLPPAKAPKFHDYISDKVTFNPLNKSVAS